MRSRRPTPIQVTALLEKQDREVNERFCPVCSVGHLEPHPELIDWRKCCICGYCKRNNDNERSGCGKSINSKF